MRSLAAIGAFLRPHFSDLLRPLKKQTRIRKLLSKETTRRPRRRRPQGPRHNSPSPAAKTPGTEAQLTVPGGEDPRDRGGG
eukprot:CAMPEP_0172590188 /NCGR_PEP_ID=MMETSP1068-20121228/8616_1 /TAXON_ID=35684 /ORGANISM="Pseudopedinella elastica, Strain CCMP716" /LENGTH=80 /DNA_ID=CAMNT_0013385895 /DNA_START=231 /DNA_END=469 /DNA_ORIENTATION=-